MIDSLNANIELLQKKDPILALKVLNLSHTPKPIALAPCPALEHLQAFQAWFVPVNCCLQESELMLWLSQNIMHRLVVLVEDFELLKDWLSLSSASSFLQNPQVYLLCSQAGSQSLEGLVGPKVWACPGFEISYYDPLGQWQQLGPILQAHSYHKQAVVAELMHYGKWSWPNILRRLKRVGSEKALAGSMGWQGVPIAICAAGPSIARQKQALIQHKDRFLILSAGTGVNVLEQMGIEPNLAILIDPFRAQFSRFVLVHNPEIAHAAGWRANYRALECLSGPRILLPCANAYPLAHDWWQVLGHEPVVFDEGYNVVAASLSMCNRMGGELIGILGVDLAFEHDMHYAGQVAQSEKFWTAGAALEQTVQAQGIDGMPVKSLAKWLLEAQWLADAAHSCQRPVVRVADAGLAIDMPTCESLGDLADQWPQRDYGAWSWAWTCQLHQADPQGKSELLLQNLIDDLDQTCKVLNCTSQNLHNILQVRHIELDKGPSYNDCMQLLDEHSLMQLERAQADLQCQGLYEGLLKVWSLCFERVIHNSFESLNSQGRTYLDAWLWCKRFQFILTGINRLKEWACQAQEGLAHVSDEV